MGQYIDQEGNWNSALFEERKTYIDSTVSAKSTGEMIRQNVINSVTVFIPYSVVTIMTSKYSH
jgi:hypothetical protein